MVSIKFNGAVQKEMLDYEFYETIDGKERLLRIDFKWKQVEIRDKDGKAIREIKFGNDILDGSIISFHKDPSRE